MGLCDDQLLRLDGRVEQPDKPAYLAKTWVGFGFLALLLTSCASTASREFEQHREEYRSRAAEPTPSDWKPGAVWAFVTTRPGGDTENVTFRVSDDKVKTCTSGDWRKLELVEGKLGSLAGTPFEAAYLVEGRNLWISLTSNWCDIDNDLKGELQGHRFEGQHASGGMMGSTLIGQVRGWRVK